MKAMQDVCAFFRFSTHGLPEAARAKAVRELYERTRIEPLEVLPDCVVRVDITKFALPVSASCPGCSADCAKRPGPGGRPAVRTIFSSVSICAGPALRSNAIKS